MILQHGNPLIRPGFTFGTGPLMCLFGVFNLGVNEIIWGLKFRGPSVLSVV